MSDSQLLQQRANARVGTTIADKWMIEALLGIGGMATVYAARHRNGKRVAIKILHSELCLSEEALNRFVREGYLANLVEHPGAVSVLDDGTLSDGTPFLVMEFLEGETVEARCDRLTGKLDLPTTLAIFDIVLDTLSAAHAKRVVHRDIKPENIFLTSDGGVKILDFGIAKAADVGLGPSATMSGTAIGTPTFMAPEQARGDRDHIDARTDLWAVGASLFTTLTGQFVHTGRNVNELLVAAIMKPARSISSVLPSLPGAIADVIDSSLKYDPDERFQEAQAMRRALQQAAAQEGIEVPAKIGLQGYAPPPPPSRMTFASNSEVFSQRVAPSRASGPTVHETPTERPPSQPQIQQSPPISESPRGGIEIDTQTQTPRQRNNKVILLAVAAVATLGLTGVIAANVDHTSAAAATSAASIAKSASAESTNSPNATPTSTTQVAPSGQSAPPASAVASSKPTAAPSAKPTVTAPVMRPSTGGAKDLGDSRN